MNETFDSSFNDHLTYRVFKPTKSRSIWKRKRMQLQAEVFPDSRRNDVKNTSRDYTRDTATFDRWEIVQDREIVLHAIYNRMLKDRSM